MGASRRRLQLSIVPVTSVEYRIVFGYNGPPSAAYDALIAAIDNAVTTGHFTALLRSHASLVGVSAPDLPTFSNYTLIPAGKSSGSTSTVASNNAGVIAGSVVAVLAALLLLLLLVFCCRHTPSEDKKKPPTSDIEQAAHDNYMHEPHKAFDYDAFNRDNLHNSGSTMSIGSDKSLLEHYDESESREHSEDVPTRDGRPTSRVVIPMDLLPPTNNRPGQPSTDPSSRVPPLPGRQPRRSIKYSFFKRRGSRGSESSKVETMSFRSSASHTGTLADLDLALGRFSVERELES